MSHGDKRSVHTDALETLGTIIGEGEARDAIHLAVEPAIAGERLRPGEHVTLIAGKAMLAEIGGGIGIVDPFLTAPVAQGERFWLVVYPRKITSLRHVWTHPDFENVSDINSPKIDDVKEASMRWIEDYASGLGDEYRITASDLIDRARTWCGDNVGRWGGDYLVKGGDLEGVSTDPDFWRHFTVVTGLTPKDGPQDFFSCSC